MCDCGCGGCSPTKPVLINENLAPKEILSEGLKYHMDNARPLTEHVYRAGSQKYFELWAEARALYARNILEVQGDDWYISNASLRNAQDTSFSPDEFTLIQDIPRKTISETFDFKFEFYDINNNYIPVDVFATKEFDGG